MPILVLGDESDEHAAHIFAQIETRGGDVEFLDCTAFPTKMQISFTPQTREGRIVTSAGRQMEWSEVSAVYWRSYSSVGAPQLLNTEQTYIAANDSRALFETLLIALPTMWVNGWEGYQLHQRKPAALAKIAALGFPVPHTVLTNDPAAVQAFAAAHQRCIFKPVQGGAFTEALSPMHLERENLNNLGFAPVTIQTAVPGSDIRVFVAGETVCACEIQTTATDFRDDPQAPITPHALPPEIEQRSRDIAAALHLIWTGIDYRRTHAGEYVFLEANPSPMFIGFEQRSGLPLTEMLVSLLMASSANG